MLPNERDNLLMRGQRAETETVGTLDCETRELWIWDEGWLTSNREGCGVRPCLYRVDERGIGQVMKRKVPTVR